MPGRVVSPKGSPRRASSIRSRKANRCRLDFQDRISGDRQIIDYKDFTAGDRAGEGDDRLIRLTGVIGLTCLGDVSYETQQEIVKPAEGCPTAGRVRVRVLNLATVSVIVYRADGGVDLLADDGTLLRTFDSCEDLTFQGRCGES